MVQETSWALEEMARAIHAERLEAAAKARLAEAVRGPRPSPRVVLAQALRALAALLDGSPASAPASQDCRLARAA